MARKLVTEQTGPNTWVTTAAPGGCVLVLVMIGGAAGIGYVGQQLWRHPVIPLLLLGITGVCYGWLRLAGWLVDRWYRR